MMVTLLIQLTAAEQESRPNVCEADSDCLPDEKCIHPPWCMKACMELTDVERDLCRFKGCQKIEPPELIPPILTIPIDTTQNPGTPEVADRTCEDGITVCDGHYNGVWGLVDEFCRCDTPRPGKYCKCMIPGV